MASEKVTPGQHIFARRFKQALNSLTRTVKTKDYSYQSLPYADSIRLLVLEPGKESSAIQISLQKARLSDERDYEAVSYTWADEQGDDASTIRINCEGGYIHVTRNCEAALRRFRTRDAPRTLWMDAICIDQNNLNERGQQVGIMRMIYARAMRVLIWLGEASVEIDAATSSPVSDVFLDQVAAVAGQLRTLPPGALPRESNLYCELLDDIYDPVVTGRANSPYLGLKSIIGRRWWTRIWVVQEALVAKTAVLFCGKKMALYEDLCCLYDNLDSDPSQESYFFRNNTLSGGEVSSHMTMSHYARFDLSGHSTQNRYVLAFATMLESRYLKATDPRDKIFGISGLCENMQSALPSPDYKLGEVEIYTQVFESWLLGSQTLYLLYLAGGAEQRPGFPTWVTDWSRPLAMFYAPQTTGWYDAARNSEAICAVSEDGKMLRAKGIVVDAVAQISFAAPSSYVYAGSLINGIPGWITSCELWDTWATGAGAGAGADERQRRETLCKALCWNCISTAGTAPATAATQMYFEEWYQILMQCKDGDELARERTTTFDQFGRIAMTLPLCITREGRLASVPATTRAGDYIVVLAGGHIPFVLRPVGDQYTLVGHCYVHGIMDGEAFPWTLAGLEWLSII